MSRTKCQPVKKPETIPEQIFDRLKQIQKINPIFNTNLPAANADILGENDLSPEYSPSTFLLNIAVAVSGIISLAIKVGGTTVTAQLNSGNALSNNVLYAFEIPVNDAFQYNFRYSATGGNILMMTVDEMPDEG